MECDPLQLFSQQIHKHTLTLSRAKNIHNMRRQCALIAAVHGHAIQCGTFYGAIFCSWFYFCHCSVFNIFCNNFFSTYILLSDKILNIVAISCNVYLASQKIRLRFFVFLLFCSLVSHYQLCLIVTAPLLASCFRFFLGNFHSLFMFSAVNFDGKSAKACSLDKEIH